MFGNEFDTVLISIKFVQDFRVIKQIILKLKVQFRNKKCYQGQSIVFIIGEKKTY
jgi:hypothetical protein